MSVCQSARMPMIVTQCRTCLVEQECPSLLGVHPCYPHTLTHSCPRPVTPNAPYTRHYPPPPPSGSSKLKGSSGEFSFVRHSVVAVVVLPVRRTVLGATVRPVRVCPPRTVSVRQYTTVSYARLNKFEKSVEECHAADSKSSSDQRNV
ncbi:hypothetical protein E2C01_097849 [Portunus trituberculatus]|uniref:Uncharacterized protein n=1 Tax=Portunus trituberculatus TaxID=210409 RepID=A0A5B7KCF9_PORTR|nr:hypothetical protein [Portunus trituberculatus]